MKKPAVFPALSIAVSLAILLALPPALSAQAQEPTVHHIVLFDLKDSTTQEQMDDMIRAGENLIAQIPGVLEVSIDRLARSDRPVHIADYDLAMYVRWQNNEVGDSYGPHDYHQEFISQFGPLVESIRVLDFYGNPPQQ